ncbi:hypothetical protein BST33_00155 [Mycolicibacter minnesotensis]|uniref:Uncharacterized protein n=1 Tax=Mycolicibacter minnesotensis TaxID=1118379 RepID=A0A7I7RA50_9MYCO|nr:hypothetical protein [Mycolicibacter minnesotensis]ORB04356.1 hypothetical protein BST33_00155 [Mycolicibacter minnesotensis]BBY34930.1 hypothetical protein MMIN_29910 [Mycolicibacter minnesotensis]
MDDEEFFDVLYQGWSTTTGAENMFWSIVEHQDLDTDRRFSVDAIDQDKRAIRVAEGLTEDDAAFVTAIHGCFADLHRRLHVALDAAECFNVDRDERECRIAELELEVQELKEAR